MRSAGSKHHNDPESFVEYSSNMDGIYENIDECNTNRKYKILIVFDTFGDMLSN